MSMHVTITSCVLLVVLLCTVHLLLGVWIGSAFKAGRWQFAGQATNPAIAKACAELQARLSDTTNLSDEANRLFQVCTRHRPALPPEIVAATDRLAKTTAALRAGLESVSKLFSRRSQRSQDLATGSLLTPETRPQDCVTSLKRRRRPRIHTKQHPEQTCEEARFSLTREEFNTMTDNIQAADSESHIDRYRYDVFQPIAPFNGELPTAESFIKVRCRDLSRGGFSYFVDDVPNYESLIVVLGSPPDLTFLVAQVEHYREESIDGQRGYLVGCRFLEQVKDVYAWNAFSDSIVTTAEVETAVAS